MRVALLTLLVCGGAASALAQAALSAQATSGSTPDLSVPPLRWAEQAASNEERMVNYDNSSPLRYRTRKVDSKGEGLREVIESKEGTVARLLERNGHSLSAEENTAEKERLQSILDAPDTFFRHARHEDGSKVYATELLHSMPKAMLWSYVPHQPQLPGAPVVAVVLDFQPDPQFKPPSLFTEALTGIAGRIWIDASSHCVTRIQGRILHPINFGWGGMLARIQEGGTVEMEQRKVSDRRWLYQHLAERLSIREMMIHTVEENEEITVTDVQQLSGPVSYRNAIQDLLALPVATHQ